MNQHFIDPMGLGRLRKYTATLLLFSLLLALTPSIQAAPQSGEVQWQPVDGEFATVSADAVNVWALKADDTIWRRPVDGSGKWNRVNGKLREISATGAGYIWGTNAATNIYKCAKPCPADGSGWKKVDGSGGSISANDTMVWVVSPDGSVRRRPVNGSGRWADMNTKLRSVSAAGNGYIWGVNSSNFVYKCRTPCRADGRRWQKTPGQMQRVEAAGDWVISIELDGTMRRKPIDGQGPWQPIAGNARSIASAGNGWIWAVNPTSMIYKTKIDHSTLVASTRPRPKPPTTRPPATAEKPKPKPEPKPEPEPKPTKPVVTPEPPKVIQGTAVVTPPKPKPQPKPEPPKVIQGTVVITQTQPQPKPVEATVIIGDVIIGTPVVAKPKPEAETQPAKPSDPRLGGAIVIASSTLDYNYATMPAGLQGLNTFSSQGTTFVDQDAFCWKENYGRVSLPTECGDGILDVGMCYPKCREGYHRHLTICYEDCPEGYVDDLALCRRPPHTIAKLSYGNTAGVPLVCPPGSEEGAGLCYTPCRDGYYGLAGICWEDSCPEGYNNDPLTCRRDPSTISKDSFDRGFGTSKVCGEGYEQIGALCYPTCKAGFNGELDWCRKPCPAGFHDDGVTCSIPPHATSSDNSACPWYDKCCIALGRDQGYKSHCPAGYRNDGCTCFRDAKIVSQEMYYRGQIPFNVCPKNHDADGGGALCYPNCREGYHGNGPRCWQTGCPEGYEDHPATCFKGAHIYGKNSYERGVGKMPSACPAGYEKDPGGALCYPKCKEGFHMRGPVCWRNDQQAAAVEECPEGYRDDGLLCTRDMHVFGPNSYNTGVGNFPSCPEDMNMSGGLCYKECRQGFHEVGPVCWQTCPNIVPLEFGAACAGSDQAIAKGWGSMFMAAWDVLMNAITFGSYGVAKHAALKAGTQLPQTVLESLGKWAVKHTKELPGKLKGKLDDFVKNAGKSGAKAADDAVEGVVKQADNGGEAAKDAVKAGKAEAAIDTAKAELKKKLRAEGEALAGPEPKSADFGDDSTGFQSAWTRWNDHVNSHVVSGMAANQRPQVAIEKVTQGLAAIGEAKAVLADPAGKAVKFIEEAAHGSEVGLQALSILDVTGLYGLVDSFIHPTCPADTGTGPARPANQFMAPPQGYTSFGPSFGTRGAKSDDEIEFNLSSSAQAFSERGGGAPAEKVVGATDFWVPADLWVECSSPNGTLAPLGQATAVNPSSGANITAEAPDVFPMGESTVVWTSSVEGVGSSQGTQRVTVMDTIPPMIIAAAAEYTVECSSPEGTPFVQTASAADTCDGPVELTNDAPELLPLGATVVNWSATDNSGNSNTAPQTIRVVDTTPPWLGCQEQVYATADGADGATVDFNLTANDACSVVETVTCSSASGGRFPVGATAVQCQAVDSAGLTSGCSFQVNVLPSPVAERGPNGELPPTGLIKRGEDTQE